MSFPHAAMKIEADKTKRKFHPWDNKIKPLSNTELETLLKKKKGMIK
jgi:hypothetical protein